MNLLTDIDFSSTIRDFDFTQRAARNIRRIADARDFETMDSEMIFEYLHKEMEIVPFHAYLRRYLYNRAKVSGTFSQVPDEVYIDIILSSFMENRAPYSFNPSQRKPRAFARKWLSQDSMSRTSLFSLGFGLGMSNADVSEFLTKVLKQDDFDFTDPAEVIYWHCFHNHQKYAVALALLDFYRKLPETGEINRNLWDFMRSVPQTYISNEKMLREYLSFLKWDREITRQKILAKVKFDELYDKVLTLIAEKYLSAEYDANYPESAEQKTARDIMPGDVEKILYSGVPLDDRGNLQKMSSSLLSQTFSNQRMTRQRIAKIKGGKQVVERFDLITLLFFIYAVDVEPNWPTERYLRFIDEINGLLREVGMSDIYPVHPYESFILLCLLTEDPLCSYGDIWEYSYEETE